MSQPVVELKNVNIYQGNSMVLGDVNISIQKGEFVYLVGKTGTGKSSLLKTLYGDLELKEGEGTVVGHNLKGLTWKTVPFLRRNLGVVFQDFQLLTDRNVHDNLKFVLKATGWKDENLMDEKIADVLDKVNLKTKGFKFPFELSGGEQQRVDIAFFLLSYPSSNKALRRSFSFVSKAMGINFLMTSCICWALSARVIKASIPDPFTAWVLAMQCLPLKRALRIFNFMPV